MITLERARQLIDYNLSLIPIGDNKVPFIKWKEYQDSVIDKDVFEKHYKNPKCKGVGICTGYNGLEVIDIDLKVLKSLKEQQDFWNEYISFLRDNIDMFDEKFVIYKTINNGYHILYRCSKIQGNTKIAKLKGHKECIMESRGAGGYVFVYENQISKLSYTEIKEISEIDREVLWEISKTYDFKEDEIKIETNIAQQELTTWDDFNKRNSIFDIINNDFEIIRTLKDKYIIKRYGAESAHSGYVFKDSGCMYLFSTATIYPAEKLVSPFVAYTYKHHSGDFKASASKLYKDGYGSRVVKEPKEIKEKPVINKSDLIFPIDIFPAPIQNYILECNKTLDSSIDYMGCSMLWMTSVIVGNSLEIEIKRGWKENATLWISIVGKAGIGKTPSISNIIFPIMKANNKEIKQFIKQNDKYLYYKSLDKNEQKLTEEIKKPYKSQFVVNDITLEALVDLHEESDNAVGVFKDELAGWIKDMNKYRAGSDLEFWLSSWSGKSVSFNRKTAKSAFIEKPLIPVLGGIQPSIINIFYNEENKDNGFIDRMLFSYPELEVDNYNENEINEDILLWYSDAIIEFYDSVKTKLITRNEDGDIQPYTCKMDIGAKKEWKRIFNEITSIQNSDEENEYMKSMLPKQKSYIPRFALLLNTLEHTFSKDMPITLITKESVLKAEKLSKYFVAMAKKIKVDYSEKKEVKSIIETNKDKTNKEKVLAIYRDNPDFNRKELSELLCLSRMQIHRIIKEAK